MAKLARIESCVGCPYSTWFMEDGIKHWLCLEESTAHARIHDVWVIPDWCPLPEATDERQPPSGE